jgi:hypothetical protein
VTKTECKARARKIRKQLGLFTGLQSPPLREHVRREWGSNPDYAALNHLLTAKTELTALIHDLQTQGHGQDYTP